MQQNEIDRINRIIAVGIEGRTNDKTLEELLGLTDAANGALGDLLGAFTNTDNLKAIMGDLATTKRLGQILGGFDEGADPQGSLFSALGIGTTYSVWDAIQYNHHAAVSSPTAGSLAQVLAEDIYGRTNNKTLNDLLGVVDGAGKSIGGNLGDFQANTNLQSLLAVLGGGWETANRDIYTSIEGQIGIFHEQVDTAVNITAILASETTVLDLSVADTRYIVRSLRLKAADPSTETITVRLYELVNDVLTVVDTFDINGANFATYHSLMDMFGIPHLAGDSLKVTVQVSGGAGVAVTGQYSHAKTNV